MEYAEAAPQAANRALLILQTNLSARAAHLAMLSRDRPADKYVIQLLTMTGARILASVAKLVNG